MQWQSGISKTSRTGVNITHQMILYLCPPIYGEGDILILVRDPVGSLLHTFLSAQYLVNQWLESYQICLDILMGHNKELLDFGDLDLIIKVTAIEKLKIL